MSVKDLKRSVKNAVVIPALARMPSRRTVVHFLHVAKTGGTAIHGVLPLDGRLDRLTTPSHTVFFRNHSVWMRDVARGQKVVFGIRDPMKRFVSGFYSRLRGGRFGRTVRDYEKAAFDTFPTPRDLAHALSSDDSARRQAARDAIGSILHTRVKLSDWTGTADELKARADDVVFVYQQENLNADFATVQNRLGIAPVELPTDGTEAHRLSGGFDTTLDELAKRNLRDWYAEDYRVIDACIDLFGRDGRMSPRDRGLGAA